MKRAPRTKDARATAYHEAGHAVMAWHEGVRINAVSVMPSPESWGMTDHANPLLGVPLDRDNSIRARMLAEKFVRICLAGGVAEQLASPGPQVLDVQDRRQAANVLRYLCGSAEEVDAYGRELMIQTCLVLARADVWPLVTAVAAALLERGRLSGREVRDLIQEALREKVHP